MQLEAGQILAIFLSVVGVILNLIVGVVVSIGLKLRTSDLILICMIAVTDCIFYINNIVRLSLIAVDYLQVDEMSLFPTPDWWCPYDTTMTLTTIQSSIEFVALLSIMRYVGLCHKKKLSFWVWFPLASLSVLSAVGLSLGNWYYQVFHWSASHLFCLPIINPLGFLSNNNRAYFVTWFSSFMSRFYISMIIIVFCYFKVAQAYRNAITQSGMIALRQQQAENDYDYDRDSISFNEANKIDELSKLNQQIKIQKALATLKLMGAAFAYSVCILPDMIVSIFYIQDAQPFEKNVYLVTHLLMCCGGLVNAVFVLSSHDPTKRYLLSFFVKEEDEIEY